jgi:cell fate regulator YaaT (PSP1 superfamily)
MAEIVGVRFKRAGKVYYFDPSGIEMEVNDFVVVKTARGLELGRVVIAPTQVVASEVTEPLKPVVRKAEPEDIKRAQEFEDKEGEALVECGKLIAKLGLPMKLLSAEYNLDGSRLTFFFSASERVDFRELVRELNKRFKVRVELRQLGPRDETKLIGGFGRCGRPLCCMNFLTEFSPVSIKMAKEQDLPLNPFKISGICGRLLCCLAYESEQYHAMKEKLPKPGQRVSTPMGEASVVGGNPLKETVLVELESQATVELPLSDITVEKPSPKKDSKRD